MHIRCWIFQRRVSALLRKPVFWKINKRKSIMQCGEMGKCRGVRELLVLRISWNQLPLSQWCQTWLHFPNRGWPLPALTLSFAFYRSEWSHLAWGFIVFSAGPPQLCINSQEWEAWFKTWHCYGWGLHWSTAGEAEILEFLLEGTLLMLIDSKRPNHDWSLPSPLDLIRFPY